MKETVKNQIADALIRAKENGDLNFQEMPDIVIEEPKDEKLGDFATTLAMQLARSEKKNPKVIAEAICGFLNDEADSIESAEVAGSVLQGSSRRQFFKAVSSANRTSVKRKKFCWNLSAPIPPARFTSVMAAPPLSGMHCPAS